MEMLEEINVILINYNYRNKHQLSKFFDHILQKKNNWRLSNLSFGNHKMQEIFEIEI